MVRNREYDYILLFGIVFYIRNIILLGLTTKKHCSYELRTKFRVGGALCIGFLGD